jgi:hypothetical protein
MRVFVAGEAGVRRFVAQSWRDGFPATYSAIAVADGKAAGAGATRARD